MSAITATGELDVQGAKQVARRQANTLADLSVEDAEARLEVKWDEPAAARHVLPGRVPAWGAPGRIEFVAATSNRRSCRER